VKTKLKIKKITKMASGDEMNDVAQDKNRAKKDKKHDSGAADLERVTDFMEENEFMNSNITNVSK
jgi:hypothetical protein